MNSKTSLLLAGTALLPALLLCACATTDSKPVDPVTAASLNAQLTASPAGAAAAKLAKNLTAAEVRTLLGAPVSIKPIAVGEAKGENWSYSFDGPIATHMQQVATQEVPAVNPITGRDITRPEPVFQNQDVQTIDTLHLLLFEGRLIEWKIVRDEKKRFQ